MTIRGLVLAATLAVAACGADATGPGDGEDFTVRVAVSGGVVGLSYTFELRNDGAVVGIECVRGCTFQAGDTLSRLTPAQRAAVRNAVIASGLPDSGEDVEYGTQCCDQLGYDVTYTSGTRVRSFSGSSEAIPEPLHRLARTLHLLVLDMPPLIVAQDTGLEGFDRDAITVRGAHEEFGILYVEIQYGGGCAHHDVDAVAYTGWMESNPVQVGVALAHDAHDDMCDALVTRTLRFDLLPLRDAYADAYGPGNATLILRLQAADTAPAGPALQVTYHF